MLISVCIINIYAAESSNENSIETTNEKQKLNYDSIEELPGGGKKYIYNIKNKYNDNYIVCNDIVPPEGFDPLTATDEQLSIYGFPPRPTNEEGLAFWTEIMSLSKKCIPSELYTSK